MAKVLVKHLGNGNMLAPEITNTSFIINDNILVDCGYNVFQKLVATGDINDIRHVFITHIHDDHSGSLQALCYYKEMYNQKLCYYYLPNLNSIPPLYCNDERIYFKNLVIQSYEENETIYFNSNYWVDVYESKKHHINNYVYFFNIPVNGYRYLIVISGDTEPDYNIERMTMDLIDKHDIKDYVVYHECSTDDYYIAGHSNKHLIKGTYSCEFINHMVFTHNNKDDERYDTIIENDMLKVKISS